MSKLKPLFEQEFLSSLSPKILKIILEQDDLGLKEVDVWNGLTTVIGFMLKIPKINYDPSKWIKEDIKIMKQIIRFQDISSNDDYDIIFPYEKLLQ